jgi:hypothetical protein
MHLSTGSTIERSSRLALADSDPTDTNNALFSVEA